MAKEPKRISHGFNMFEARDMIDKDFFIQDVNQNLAPDLEYMDIPVDRRERVWSWTYKCWLLPKVKKTRQIRREEKWLSKNQKRINAKKRNKAVIVSSFKDLKAALKVQKPKSSRKATVVQFMGQRGLAV